MECSPDIRMEMGLSAVSFEMAGRPIFLQKYKVFLEKIDEIINDECYN